MENCCERGYCNRMHIPHNSGDYSSCFAVHSEQNAMLSAARKDMIGATLYIAGEEYTLDEVVNFILRNTEKIQVEKYVCLRDSLYGFRPDIQLWPSIQMDEIK